MCYNTALTQNKVKYVRFKRIAGRLDFIVNKIINCLLLLCTLTVCR